jgi:putative protein kinase ArgK-like GTPase of G3E family
MREERTIRWAENGRGNSRLWEKVEEIKKEEEDHGRKGRRKWSKRKRMTIILRKRLLLPRVFV